MLYIELQGLESSLLSFDLDLVQYLLATPSSLLLEMVIFTVCLCALRTINILN